MQLRLADRTEESFGSGNIRRAVSAGLVLVFHLMILAALLFARAKTHGVSETRETTLTLLPLLRHELPAQASPNRAHLSPRQKRAPAAEQIPQNSAPPVTATPDATVLGPALNGCDLENLDKLSPEQRSRCIAYQNDVVGASRQAKDHDGLNKASRSVAAAEWAQSIVKRNMPAKVDCARVETQEFGFQDNMKATSLMVDLRCAARHLANHQSPLN